MFSSQIQNLGRAFVENIGYVNLSFQNIIMIGVGCLLIYLAIAKKYEPLLLIPIGFGSILVNIPSSGIMEEGGMLYYLYFGIKYGIFPPLIFLGIGAMTDFSPLLAHPKTFLLGAAAQFGIFATLLGAIGLGFTLPEAASIGIIGGADGPTAIFTTSILAPHLMGPVAIAAYSYMALVPIIQPPIMRLLTTKEERKIIMKQLRPVSRRERILFPVIVVILCTLLVPKATALIGMLMLGNLMRESGVVKRLSRTAQNEIINITTIFLGICIGATMKGEVFLTSGTLKILVLGVIAFSIATASGILFGKLMSFFSKEPINPLIGAAGVSAVPMAARAVQREGQRENPNNFLLMHAMGPNVAGVIGSAIAAGILLAILG